MTQGQFVDRRSGKDRRNHPERRQGPDRRSGFDRRRLTYGEDGVVRFPVPDRLAADRQPNSGDPPLNEEAWTFVPTNREMLDRIGGVVSELVSGFYDASLDGRLWRDVLGSFARAVHADTASITYYDFSIGRGRIEHTFNVDAMYVTAYADFYSQDDVWVQQNDRFRTPGTVCTGHQLIRESRLIETDFYRYWLRPQNLFHHLFGIVDSDGERSTFLSFARAPEKGAFWEDDIDLLDRLLPTLRRGLLAGHSGRRSKTLQRIILDLLDAMPIGIILVNANGTVGAANRTARDLIDGEEPFYLGNGGLGLRLAAGRFRFRDLVGEGPARGPDKLSEVQTMSVPRGTERRPLTLLIVPVQDRTQLRGADDPAVVVFIGDPERPVEMDNRRLTRIYGLSRAEARVAALLATGLRLDQVAESLGLTYETVRKHLKQIFGKTGTDRQAELVRTLVTGPCGLRF